MAIFFAFTGFCGLNFTYADVESQTFIVSTNSAIVYQTPSLSAERIKTLSHKTEIEIEVSSSVPIEYVDGSYVFYHICDDGYILSNAVSLKVKTITSIPNFNAKTNTKCNIYTLDENSYVKTADTLENKTQIFLYEGYNSKNKFTAIAYVKNNEVFYGFIETKFVNPNGINPVIITVATLVVAILGVAFAFVFIKGRKKKKLA